MNILRAGVIGTAVMLAGCTDSSTSTVPKARPGETASLSTASAVSAWMPEGTKVPVGTPLAALPAPPSESVAFNAPPSAQAPISQMPPAYAIAAHYMRNRPQGARSRQSLLPPPDQGDAGFYLHQNTNAWYGVYSVHDIGTSITLPPPDSSVLYAPTLLAPGGSCIEMTTAHFGRPIQHQLWAWDWCRGSLGQGTLALRWDLTDPGFQSTYVRTYNGRPTIVVANVTPNTGSTNGQCWYMNIYNYIVGGYVQLFTSCGYTLTNEVETGLGWSMWEEHYFTAPNLCPSVASVGASAISFANNGAWDPITNHPSDYTQFNYGSCWTGGGYSFITPVSGASDGSWRALTQ